MKKTLISETLTLATFAMQAQPMLSDVAVYDDFSTQTEYSVDEQGTIYWWVTAGKQVVTRDSENKQLDVSMSQVAYQYIPFGVGFGTTAGTEEYIEKKQLMLYPNPANSSLTIQSEGQVQITTILGQVIYRNAINNSITIDLSTFDAGIYFVDNGHQIQKLAIEK